MGGHAGTSSGVRRVRGEGWFADLPDALAARVGAGAGGMRMVAAAAGDARAGDVLLRGVVLFERDGWTVASCGGLLAGCAAAALPVEAPVHVILPSAPGASA